MWLFLLILGPFFFVSLLWIRSLLFLMCTTIAGTQPAQKWICSLFSWEVGGGYILFINAVIVTFKCNLSLMQLPWKEKQYLISMIRKYFGDVHAWVTCSIWDREPLLLVCLSKRSDPLQPVITCIDTALQKLSNNYSLTLSSSGHFSAFHNTNSLSAASDVVAPGCCQWLLTERHRAPANTQTDQTNLRTSVQSGAWLQPTIQPL